jgi:hypothetical protein
MVQDEISPRLSVTLTREGTQHASATFVSRYARLGNGPRSGRLFRLLAPESVTDEINVGGTILAIELETLVTALMCGQYPASAIRRP